MKPVSWLAATFAVAVTAGAAALAQSARSGNPILPGWYADPEAHVFAGEYWIYPTYSAPYDQQTFMDAFSSRDLITWQKHARVLDVRDVSWARRALWAPSIVEKNGWYYLFFGANDIQNDEQVGGIGVARSRRPDGPFLDYLGKPLIDKFHNGAQPIDQMVFKDRDGSYYIVYGGWRHCNIAKLNADFTGFVPFPDGSTFREITPAGYVEGAFMLLKDNRYYFMWSEGGWTGPNYAVAYAIGSSPFGPFERVGKILQQDSSVATGAGHHSVVQSPASGKWYIVYHRRPLGETDRNHRAVSIDELHFDERGFILPVKITTTGVPADPIDTSGRERFAAFNREYQARSAPMAKAGNYLGILLLLQDLEASAGPNPDVRSMSSQMIGTYDSFLGQDQNALASFATAFFPNGPVKRPPVDSASFIGYEPEDAVDAIAKLAAGRQAVFINEAHHVPRHRALTLALLPRLRALGFTYLAAETLDEKDSTLNTRKYPVRASGFYSNEPTFGALLRTALGLGFKVVPYEFQAPSQEARETGQARNLVERILHADPKARVVVHAGYSHIEESGTLFGAKPMAIRFREMTGIDPLTIDQTAMMQQSDSLFEEPRYRYILHRFEPRTSVILHKGDSVWSSKPGVHDVSVIQPRASYRDGRPDWLWAMQGGRWPYALPDNACRAAANCVVAARLAGEVEDAVPIDALRIGPSAVSRTLALPAGQFVVTARDAAGVLLGEWRVTVER